MSTPIPLWMALAIFFAAVAFSSVQEWFAGQYEVTRKGWHPAVTRRWYGPRAHVRFLAEADDADADRYVVLAWDSDDSAVPWLKVHKLNPEFVTYRDEDSEAIYAPVTDFAPYAVRRFRPCVTFAGWLPVPSLWEYPLLPVQVRFAVDNRTPEEVNTAYYLNTASWKRPYDPPGTMAALMRGESR